MKSRRPRAMNPAFAAAHGIQRSNEDVSINNNSNSIIHSSGTDVKNGSRSSNNSLEIVLKRAQDTGKLVVSNCAGLKAPPLPDVLFEFPFGTSQYTEDLLTVVDFSDNEDKLADSFVDERILRYRSVQSLRFRNCGMRLPEQSLSFVSLEHLTILDLSGNRLERFDVGFLLWSPDKVSPLVELNLSNNRIRELVATAQNESDTQTNSGEQESSLAVVSLPNLRSFNVSYNALLERLFDESSTNTTTNTKCASFSCENLRIFRCHHNPNLRPPSPSAASADGLPPFLRSARATLEVLEASHNPKMAIASDGSTIHIDLSGYEQLQTVSFALNKLEAVPHISNSVKTLDLRSNNLKSIQGMFSVPLSAELVDLILADNYLTKLDPLVVETMTKLQRLDVTSNKITSLPYQLGFLTELSTLNISGNPVVTRFSSSSDKHPRALLETLRKRAPVTQTDKCKTNSGSGSGSAFESGSPCSGRASSEILTRALSSRGNNTLDLAGKLTENVGGVELKGLIQELQANTTIDRGITGQIILDSNRLESLPEELLSSCLPNVQTISLADNRFTELPVSLQTSSSRRVKQLNLQKNLLTKEALDRASWFQPIASLPPSTMSDGNWSLHSLTHLDLSSNKLTSFPMDTSPSVHCFPALEILNLFHNKISSFENWKRLPESLTVLNLSENHVEDIEPLAILLAGGCPKFQRLSLQSNNVRRIPASLGLLSRYASSMVSLKLQGNPQRSVRSHFLDKSCGELLEYLSNRLTADQRKAAIESIEQHKQHQQHQQQHIKKEVLPANQHPPIVAPTLVIDARSQEAPSPPPMAIEQPPPPPTNKGENRSTNNKTNISNDGSKGDGVEDGEDTDHEALKELQQSVEKLKIELKNFSLTQAKKYAVKKALAMERSKLIREERRLGLRK